MEIDITKINELAALARREEKKRNHGPIGSGELTKDERDAVGYFFIKLKATAGTQYDSMFQTPTILSVAKREYARHIIKYSREQIDKGFDRFRELKQDGEKDYQFVDIDKIIGLMKEGITNGSSKMYQRFLPATPETEDNKRERKRVGAEKTRRILDFLDE